MIVYRRVDQSWKLIDCQTTSFMVYKAVCPSRLTANCVHMFSKRAYEVMTHAI
jgi:hypothetical protein